MSGVEALAQPIAQLAAGFGTGLPDPQSPVALLGMAADQLDEVHRQGVVAIDALDQAWSGPAAQAALATMHEVVGTAQRLSTHGTELVEIAADAAEQVLTGGAELVRLLRSFLSTVDAAGPAANTPQGQLALLGVALDHLARALAVVVRVQSALARAGGRIDALGSPPALPAAPHPPDSPTDSPVPHQGRGTTVADGVDITLPDGSVARAPNAEAAAAVRAALSQQGVPYVWGGTTPGQGLDCSGLTQWAYGQAGVDIPRLAEDQDIGTAVPAAQVQPGDLAVWDGHVAMAIGNGQLVEAGDPVQVGPLRTENLGMAFHGYFRPTQAGADDA